MKRAKKEQYLVVIGFNYGPKDKRHEEGEGPITLPAEVATALLEQQAIVVWEGGKN